MAKKTSASDPTQPIKKVLGTEKLVLGTKESIIHLKNGLTAQIFLTVNCPSYVQEDIKRYAGEAGVPVVELPLSNEELGVMCKKPFRISVASILK